jgi:hypothetical protein
VRTDHGPLHSGLGGRTRAQLRSAGSHRAQWPNPNSVEMAVGCDGADTSALQAGGGADADVARALSPQNSKDKNVTKNVDHITHEHWERSITEHSLRGS